MSTQELVGLLLVGVLLAGTSVDAQAAVIRSDPMGQSVTDMIPVTGYSDVDKIDLATLTNYYDDMNSNGAHDPGEPFAASSQGGWGNAQSASDGSCWLASGCNMLEQLGKIDDAEALYMDYALNGVASPSGILTWDEGGLQEYVIQQWMSENPAGAVGMELRTHWQEDTVRFSQYGHFAWEDWDPRAGVQSYLGDEWEVGIGMWLLYADGEHTGGHALTMQAVYGNGTFDCTDSDRDDGGQDVNTYNDLTLSGSLNSHTYYGWFNDFWSRDINIVLDGDVGYVCAVIPEPATLSLLAAAGLMLSRRKRN